MNRMNTGMFPLWTLCSDYCSCVSVTGLETDGVVFV